MQAHLFHHTTMYRMTMMKRCLSIGRAACGAILLLPLLCASAIAQEYVDWQPMPEPYGDGKPFTLFDHDSTGRIWGGHYSSSLFWSDDEGLEWHKSTFRRPRDLVVAED